MSLPKELIGGDEHEQPSYLFLVLSTRLGTLRSTFQSICRAAPRDGGFTDKETGSERAGTCSRSHSQLLWRFFPLWSLYTKWSVSQQGPWAV